MKPVHARYALKRAVLLWVLGAFLSGCSPRIPADLDALARDLKGRTPQAIEARIFELFGEPDATSGSGLMHAHWHVYGGTLTFVLDAGAIPTFGADGRHTRLWKTTSPVGVSIPGRYDMVIPDARVPDTRFWVGGSI